MKIKKKNPSDYPSLTFRPGEYKERLQQLAEKTGMSLGQIVSLCIKAQLPVIEAKHKTT